MKHPRNIAGACFSAALLAANGGVWAGATPPSGARGLPSLAYARVPASVRPLLSESPIYTFQGGSDGGSPYAGLLAGKNGTLFYGTTFEGGAKGDYGTAFELSSTGTKTILYTFQGAPDAANPQAGLTAGKNGVLFGDTDYGGDRTVCPKTPSSPGGCGTVYELSPSGSGYTERVIYSFQYGNDGAGPVGSILVAKNGELYGTTVRGGGSSACAANGGGCGTVFKLTPSGSRYAETVLYRFQGGSDGAGPRGTLIADSKGALYGTTFYGGNGACSDPSGFTGCGTAFKLTPSGSSYSESLIYNFQGGVTDGLGPRSALLAGKDGALYGTTTRGGSGDAGIVFSLARSGSSYVEHILYSFSGPDGFAPADENGLYADNSGDLYGTTQSGGVSKCECGTVFELKPSGSGYAESVLHSFKGGSDGEDPRGSLVAGAGGTLYGTTFSGAKKIHGCTSGCGVVFEVSP
jgi:uncharacterized repeat protein (TIGR03803 family)